MTTLKSPSILITGATGNVGTELAKKLSAMNIPFRAMIRSFENAGLLISLKGAEIVIGDLQDKASIAEALQGIDRAFLLTNSSEHAEVLQSNFVDVATNSGVKHIVKLSQFAADVNSPVRFLRYHAVVEQKIKNSGMAYTFLRPNLYMQGLLGFREPIMKQGKFFASIGDARISAVDIRDIAAVAAEALTDNRHEGKVYDITGPKALSHQEMADQLSKALEQTVRFISVSPSDMKQALLSVGFPVWQTEGLLEDYAHYSRGEASSVSTAVEDITGRRPYTFENFANDYALAFSDVPVL
jgi:uncharacterized protein YbjT (DUF2867 family)